MTPRHRAMAMHPANESEITLRRARLFAVCDHYLTDFDATHVQPLDPGYGVSDPSSSCRRPLSAWRGGVVFHVSSSQVQRPLSDICFCAENDSSFVKEVHAFLERMAGRHRLCRCPPVLSNQSRFPGTSTFPSRSAISNNGANTPKSMFLFLILCN